MLTMLTERLLNVFKSMVESAGGLAAASDEAIKRQEAAALAFQDALSQLKAAVLDNIHDIKSQFGTAIEQLLSTVETNVANIYRSFGKLDKSIEGWHEVCIDKTSH